MIDSRSSRQLLRILGVLLISASMSGGVIHAEPFDLGLMEASRLSREYGEWVILDARPVAEWQRARIPGALSFSWEDHIQAKSLGGDYEWPPPERLASVLGGLGVTELSPVVIYGDSDSSWGGEGWVAWVLSWLGHKGPIRLLDGGIQAWKREGFSVISGDEQVRPEVRPYALNLRHNLNVRAEELDDRGRPWVVVDTRSFMERRLAGRLPHSIHIPWSEFFYGRERRPLDGAQLSQLLGKHGVDPGAAVVFYCTAGVRSAYAWTVFTLAGSRTARSYSGGISDWMRYTRRMASGRET